MLDALDAAFGIRIITNARVSRWVSPRIGLGKASLCTTADKGHCGCAQDYQKCHGRKYGRVGDEYYRIVERGAFKI